MTVEKQENRSTGSMNLGRRAVVAGLLTAPAAAVAGPQPWTFQAYSAAMKASAGAR
jgi:hypothetical protein